MSRALEPALRPHDWRRAVADVAPLMRFRLSGMRGRHGRGARRALTVIALLTLAAAVGPAYAPGAATSARAGEVAALLAPALLGFWLTTTLAVTVAGGGRELLPRDEGVAFPVSATTDHLGALLLAPLNLAWLMQAWSLLGLAAYAVGPGGLPAATVTMVAWVLAATALAQLTAWCVEWVRRGPAGVAAVRVTAVLLAVTACGLVMTGNVAAVVAGSPTRFVAVAALAGHSGGHGETWLLGTALVVLVAAVSVVVGARAAHAVARRPPREQHRGEGRTVAVRPTPRSAMSALARGDRAGIWRSLPLRRGLATLALLPAAVTASGAVPWHLLPVLPGVVAAGGALLFGVNAWCLDGRGALWRDSLPVTPGTVFAARSRVLAEVLCVTATLPLLVAGLRIGALPSPAEAASLVATVLVVSLQVVARAMHWSVRRPYAMDLRSARGAPAPPLAMVTYAAYLSLTTTATGLVFMVTARAGGPAPALLVAVPLVLLAVRRLVVTARAWAMPQVRARVVATVAA